VDESRHDPRANPAEVKRRRKPASVRRRDIVEAALIMLRDQGVERLTTRSLSRAVSIAQPTLFLHFGSKTQVLSAVIDAVRERLQEGYAALRLEPDGARQRLSAVVRFHLDFIERQPAMARLWFAEELHLHDAVLRERLQSLVNFSLDVLARHISACQQAGQIDVALDARRCAVLLLAAMQGMALNWILDGRGSTLSEQGDWLVSSLLDGWTAGLQRAH
jgi:AcrR family transcriptional regulator